MKFKDKIRFVRQNMKKNRMRVFMTILATAIGCAFLILLASVGFGLEKSIISDLTEGRLANEINVYHDKDFNQLNDEDVEILKQIEHVKTVTKRNTLHHEMMFKLEEYESYWPQVYATNFPSEIEAGLELSDGRMPQANDEIIVGYHFNEILTEGNGNEIVYYEEDLIGKTIDLQVIYYDKEEMKQSESFPVKIVGITKQPAPKVKEQFALISEPLLKEIEDFTVEAFLNPEQSNDEDVELNLDKEKTYDDVRIYTNHLENVSGVIEKLNELGYGNYSVTNQLGQINTLFLVIKIGLIFVGTIALLIASIGIFNTMTMSVTERTQDIGIMKAIGAHPSTIKQIFLIESSYIGLIGAFIGTLFAYVISIVINFVTPMIIEALSGNEGATTQDIMLTYIPISLVATSVSISLLVAIFSGWRPAKKATTVDVLKAMRRDI
ncbi:ABC transporter permease [Chengkuizengella marina]|uniref:FtsX-like permease family protein n=1 Tax=Chengkuizengella marina TaxID=2507566 RepID=A0A6N9PZ89_9BACL|nr:ABC transporter permease [Chengkuizengella marina]NBI28841.1 FtsX-like permease family protein [Chengkuizengella marina]